MKFFFLVEHQSCLSLKDFKAKGLSVFQLHAFKTMVSALLWIYRKLHHWILFRARPSRAISMFSRGVKGTLHVLITLFLKICGFHFRFFKNLWVPWNPQNSHYLRPCKRLKLGLKENHLINARLFKENYFEKTFMDNQWRNAMSLARAHR